MIGDKTLLSKFVEKVGPRVTFGDDSKDFTMGYGRIEKQSVIIERVTFVQGLKHNLLSVSQLSDNGNEVSFNEEPCLIKDDQTGETIMIGVRKGNVYIAHFNSSSQEGYTCLFNKATMDESWTWNKKFSHLNFKAMNSLVKKELVRGLPQLEFVQDGLCDSCQKGKQTKVSFRSK